MAGFIQPRDEEFCCLHNAPESCHVYLGASHLTVPQKGQASLQPVASVLHSGKSSSSMYEGLVAYAYPLHWYGTFFC